ncbi:MAG: LacI family DNA-binding transcriptional regulator [Acidobacteria bacterium]|nr:LacI family DNA-binding transcriptional regulator [Acidobacteriota bacterium]
MNENPSTSQRKKKRRPTLHDVAQMAGVGTTTVSRVINGGHYVDPTTMSRVQGVMHQLGYQPSQAARSLKAEKTHSIGMIVPTLRDPFFANLASAVQQVTRQKNYLLIVLASEDDPLQETAELDRFRSYRVDGMLVVPPRVQTQRFLSAVRSLAIPTVALDRPLEMRGSSVICDNFEAAKNAVQHLLAHGRRRVLCLGGDPSLYTIQERVRGYQEAVAEARLKPRVLSGADPRQLTSALKERFANLRERPDGIFAAYGDASVVAYEFLVDSSYKIPQDVALIGFDEFPLAGTLRPTLSVIRQPIQELGTTAARILFEQIEGEPGNPRRITIATELIPRMSCGCESRMNGPRHP